MRLSHTLGRTSAAFDDPNLVSAGGLVPVVAPAESAGLGALADEHLTVPTDKGANAGLKVTSLVGGMVAGADSIDDMALLRHGGMERLFTRVYAPSTLGSFLRSLTFGHVRQLDAIASRFLIALAGLPTSWATRLLLLALPIPMPGMRWLMSMTPSSRSTATATRVRGSATPGPVGLNALLATLTTATTAPVIVAQRLCKGPCGSPRGAKRLVADAVKTTRRLLGTTRQVLVRMDSAFYSHAAAALAGGARASVTGRRDPAGKKAIATITEEAWTSIEYTNAIFDEATNAWISRAEVAEVPFTAFARKKNNRAPGRLVVRWIPDFNAEAHRAAGQETLFDVWRFHAFFTTADHEVLDTLAADKTRRRHAVIEQVHAGLKHSALAHLPSGVFTANAAWLVLAVIAFNLTRSAASLTEPDLLRATTATIRRKLISVPARVATSACRITLHLPVAWPWHAPWMALFDRVHGPPPAHAA